MKKNVTLIASVDATPITKRQNSYQSQSNTHDVYYDAVAPILLPSYGIITFAVTLLIIYVICQIVIPAGVLFFMFKKKKNSTIKCPHCKNDILKAKDKYPEKCPYCGNKIFLTQN